MLESQWYKKELENSDSDIKHRSLSEEYSFFEAVKDGNIEEFPDQFKISFCYYGRFGHPLLHRRGDGDGAGLPPQRLLYTAYGFVYIDKRDLRTP